MESRCQESNHPLDVDEYGTFHFDVEFRVHDIINQNVLGLGSLDRSVKETSGHETEVHGARTPGTVCTVVLSRGVYSEDDIPSILLFLGISGT